LSDIQITLEGKTHDLDEFSLGDLEWLEEFLEAPLDGETLTSMKGAVGLVYLVKRQDDPEFTLEQARQTKLSVLTATGADEGEPAAKKRPPKRAAR
jgi:hypothetical protein